MCLKGEHAWRWQARCRCFLMSGAASAQTPAPAAANPNTGALTFTGGLDVPTKYMFRGLSQEADSKLTLFPYGDLGIAFYSGEGAIKTASVNFGVWNALLTGSSGLDGDTRQAPLRRGLLRDAEPRVRARVLARHDLHRLHQPERHVQHRPGADVQGGEVAHARALRHRGVRARWTGRRRRTRRDLPRAWRRPRAGRWPAAK